MEHQPVEIDRIRRRAVLETDSKECRIDNSEWPGVPGVLEQLRARFGPCGAVRGCEGAERQRGGRRRGQDALDGGKDLSVRHHAPVCAKHLDLEEPGEEREDSEA
eukprot:1597454-Rhodomonas_salina.2